MAISAVILGQRLKKARKEKGFTQEEIAEKIGLSAFHLGRIERGAKPIYLHKLCEWCDVLDVPVEHIISGASIPSNPTYNQQFGEIAANCSPETIATMLDMCQKLAEIEKRNMPPLK